MHSLVNFCMWPDWGTNPQPWRIQPRPRHVPLSVIRNENICCVVLTSLSAFPSPAHFLLSYWTLWSPMKKADHISQLPLIHALSCPWHVFPDVFTHCSPPPSRLSRPLHALESHSDSISIPIRSGSGWGTGLCHRRGAVPTEYKIVMHISVVWCPQVCAYILCIQTS